MGQDAGQPPVLRRRHVELPGHFMSLCARWNREARVGHRLEPDLFGHGLFGEIEPEFSAIALALLPRMIMNLYGDPRVLRQLDSGAFRDKKTAAAGRPSG